MLAVGQDSSQAVFPALDRRCDRLLPVKLDHCVWEPSAVGA